MAKQNPFAPTFGASPPVLAGRTDILDDFADALETGPTHPEYTVLIIGARGSGKTSLLNAVEDVARERGWLTISVDATAKGLLTRLTDEARRLFETLREPPASTKVTGVRVAGVGLDLQREPAVPNQPGDLRGLLETITDLLGVNGSGLLVTIDELHNADPAEVKAFGAVVQHITRRAQRPLAFAGAALPQIEEALLSDESATFLQRCSRIDLDRLSDRDTAEAVGRPITDRGGRIDPAELRRAVAATSGYPFMVQLVGFHIWREALDPAKGITPAEVGRGIAAAERRIGRLILEPTWKGLSDVDRRFLAAMAKDDGPSRMTDVASRLGVEVGYAGVYRQRLIRSGLVVAAGRGFVDFAQQVTRPWLRSLTDADTAGRE